MDIDGSVFPKGFEEFAALGKFALTLQSGAVVMADSPGGEIRFHIRVGEKGAYELSRAERGGAGRLIMWSSDPVDLERYLITEVGVSVRERLGLARLRFPTRIDQIVDRFGVEELAPKVFALRRKSGELLSSRFPKAGVGAPIFAFAQIAELDVDALRETYLDPEGNPGLTMVIRD